LASATSRRVRSPFLEGHEPGSGVGDKRAHKKKAQNDVLFVISRATIATRVDPAGHLGGVQLLHDPLGMAEVRAEFALAEMPLVNWSGRVLCLLGGFARPRPSFRRDVPIELFDRQLDEITTREVLFGQAELVTNSAIDRLGRPE
jgi:hypothetical protein